LHDYYPRHGFYLDFHFDSGYYAGFRYYYPYHSYISDYDYAFFYPEPVSYAYVPFGFYMDTTPIYIDRTVYVREDYPITKYETVEATEPPAEQAGTPAKEVEPQPASASPTVERFLREASEAFKQADYKKAAERFRLAAISAPDQAAPLFAYSQALLALGQDAYAAKVLRRAVTLNADLVREPGDIVGVYKDQQEFDRVLTALEKRAAASGTGSDARLLLGAMRYFSGDPRARETFAALAAAHPDDPAVSLFRTAVEKRFKAAADLPPVPGTSASD